MYTTCNQSVYIFLFVWYNERMKVKYELRKSENNDFKFVRDAKITTIFDYAKNISEEERKDILSYVDRFTNKFLSEYKIIVKDNKNCGVFLVRDYEDGVLLDEIYLIPECRNLGIGSDVIKKELKKQGKVYLWVYKENARAVGLYKKLGFNVFEDKGERYLMVYNKCNN